MNQTKRKKPLVKNPYRKFFQWGVLAILAILALRSWFGSANVDWEAYCPFGGLSAFFRYSYAETLACTMTTVQIFMGIMLFVGVLLLAKLFCGYICPLGTVSEWLGKIGKRFRMRFEITGIADKALRSLKYILLFLTLYFTIRSGELFCKTYDPYFAVADGFGHDVVTLYALIAIGLLVVGSIFVRMFFCRYLCPLGAISNIFTYFGMFGLSIIIFLVLNIIGFHISWIWLLGAISLFAYILEITQAGRKIFPVFAITRDNTFCKDCSLCDKACPQGISITSYKDRVSHPDCTMCSECLQACPRTDSIGINGKKNIKWFPAVALALLIAIGFGLGNTIEVPTIDEQWGTDEQHARSEIYYQGGIDRVTCFGSARAFSNQLHKVDGIIGISVFVAGQRVRIEYDPSMINENGIREAIFVPYSSYVNRPGPDVEEISFVNLAIDDFMNRTDFTNFGRLLSEHEGVYAFETMYGEPVITIVYFDAERFDPALLPEIVETKEVTYVQNDQKVNKKLNFHFDHMEEETGSITPLALEQRWFRAYNARFNKFDTRQPDEIAVYEIEMPQAKEPTLYRWLSYMMSHLSLSGGFVGLDTKFTEEVPKAEIRFLPAERTMEEIFQLINADSLQVRFSDGREQKFVNPFTFEKEGKRID
jgi:polyferredoxin/copper chaperone CopZ